ncbi:MAG: GlsB/YeaQ/YmgE family stress response membrane protein [Phaeodactylibacter sp.]|nr:GlsB/YeaQ/YmgE family stress response membrane protein [Phaeodactylibacter sp.]
MGLLYTLIVGAIAGWLAGKIMKGEGFGLLINIILGIVGAYVGNWLFNQLGISVADGTLGTILTSTAGAVVILFLAGLIKKK